MHISIGLRSARPAADHCGRLPGGELIFWESLRWFVNVLGGSHCRVIFSAILGGSQVVCSHFGRLPGGVFIFWEAPRWSGNILGGSQVVCKCFRWLPGVGLYFAKWSVNILGGSQFDSYVFGGSQVES